MFGIFNIINDGHRRTFTKSFCSSGGISFYVLLLVYQVIQCIFCHTYILLNIKGFMVSLSSNILECCSLILLCHSFLSVSSTKSVYFFTIVTII